MDQPTDRMRPEDADELYMMLALAEARKAARRNEVPVGAVVVYEGQAIASGFNQPIRRSDPTAHAEIMALRKAARVIGNYRLTGCDLFVTLEPCLMCAGALVQARIRRLVFAAVDEKGGAVVSNGHVLTSRGVYHAVKVISGVLQDESQTLLRSFFKKLRAAK